MRSVPGNPPLASLSLDLDNEWAYLKTRGDPAWETYPSYLDRALPRIEAALERHGLRITVFVVGQDASLGRHDTELQRLAQRGHEIGNHSMVHEPWLADRSEHDIDAELAASERAIERATGVRPVGFRGPGFSLGPEMLQVLARRGYHYDASTFPSIVGPLARAYYLMRSGASPAQRQRLKRLFGGWRDGLRPLRPYAWNLGGRVLVEMPVTTMPLLRLPMHLSYVMFLAGFSVPLALTYFRAGLALCRVRGVEPSVLLHPLDFLDADDVPSLRFFPTMGLRAQVKERVMTEVLNQLTQSFEVVPVGEHAQRAMTRTALPRLEFAS